MSDDIFERLAKRIGISADEARGRLLRAREERVARQPLQAPEPKRSPMTGRDLLEALVNLPPEALDLPIATEGCDCWGDVGEVSVDSVNVNLHRV